MRVKFLLNDDAVPNAKSRRLWAVKDNKCVVPLTVYRIAGMLFVKSSARVVTKLRQNKYTAIFTTQLEARKEVDPGTWKKAWWIDWDGKQASDD